MSRGSDDLFEGEDVGSEVFDVGTQGSDGIGRRGDLVRDISEVHEEVRNVLSYGWDFDFFSGDNWWDFEAWYEGDSGRVTVSGRPDGRIDLVYRTESVAMIPDYVQDEIDYLNINRDPEAVSSVEEEAAGIKLTLEKDFDPEDEEAIRYIRDVVGLYAGVDGDAAYPSFEEQRSGERDRWWM